MAVDHIPFGSNERGSAVLFYERKYYKNDVWPTYGPVPIDVLYEKPFYAKVDIYGNPVYISEAYLKPLNGGEGKQFALNFVADAFNDLRDYMARTATRQRIIPMFKGFNPQKSWESIHGLYHEYFSESLFAAFMSTYLTPAIKKQIITFDDFVNKFMAFCQIAKKDFPITKSGFITSVGASNHIGGMMIDLTTIDKSSDREKYTKFIQNESFDAFREAASDFGFFVDKNSPSTLAINLASNKTKEYMARYGVAAKNNTMFKKYYYRAETFDYQSFKIYLYQGYRSFIASEPFFVEAQGKICGPITQNISIMDLNYKTHTKIVERESVSYKLSEFYSQYGEEYFLDKYFKVRLLESKMNLGMTEYKMKFKKIKSYYKSIGLPSALAEIGYTTKTTRIYEKPSPSSKPPYKIKFFGKTTTSGLTPINSDDMMSYGTTVMY